MRKKTEPRTRSLRWEKKIWYFYPSFTMFWFFFLFYNVRNILLEKDMTGGAVRAWPSQKEGERGTREAATALSCPCRAQSVQPHAVLCLQDRGLALEGPTPLAPWDLTMTEQEAIYREWGAKEHLCRPSHTASPAEEKPGHQSQAPSSAHHHQPESNHAESTNTFYSRLVL